MKKLSKLFYGLSLKALQSQDLLIFSIIIHPCLPETVSEMLLKVRLARIMGAAKRNRMLKKKKRQNNSQLVRPI